MSYVCPDIQTAEAIRHLHEGAPERQWSAPMLMTINGSNGRIRLNRISQRYAQCRISIAPEHTRHVPNQLHWLESDGRSIGAESAGMIGLCQRQT